MGAGSPVFGSARKLAATTEKKADEEAEDGEEAPATDEYDPHYEPIVPLPDAVVVSTGEEEETQLFIERAKLFRYDVSTKEWKERGVGQIKVLHHPVKSKCYFRCDCVRLSASLLTKAILGQFYAILLHELWFLF